MRRHSLIAIRMAFATMALFGILYPLVMTGLAQLLFPKQANGSLVKIHNRFIGSELIGQRFTRSDYFHSRPSVAGKGYDASSSGGSNLGPTSKVLAEAVRLRSMSICRENPSVDVSQIPVDMVTASGSGLDPDITVANAYAQIARVAKARGLSDAYVRQLVSDHTTRRVFGILGEPRVNVLRINLVLDETGMLKQ